MNKKTKEQIDKGNKVLGAYMNFTRVCKLGPYMEMYDKRFVEVDEEDYEQLSPFFHIHVAMEATSPNGETAFTFNSQIFSSEVTQINDEDGTVRHYVEVSDEFPRRDFELAVLGEFITKWRLLIEVADNGESDIS